MFQTFEYPTQRPSWSRAQVVRHGDGAVGGQALRRAAHRKLCAKLSFRFRKTSSSMLLTCMLLKPYSRPTTRRQGFQLFDLDTVCQMPSLGARDTQRTTRKVESLIVKTFNTGTIPLTSLYEEVLGIGCLHPPKFT